MLVEILFKFLAIAGLFGFAVLTAIESGLSWVKDFQILVAGVFGFIGVMATLFFKARIERDQWIDEQRHERETLRSALIVELKINKKAFSQETKGENGAFVPTSILDDVYRSFVPRLGILTDKEVAKVMYAYLTIRTHLQALYFHGNPSPVVPGYVIWLFLLIRHRR
jgi:hypothetical protein